MATHQDVTDTVQVDVLFGFAGNNAQWVLHVLYTGAVGEAQLDALEGAISAWLTADWAPLAAVGWQALGCVITDLNSLAGKRKAYTFTPAIDGSLAETPLPASVTQAIKLDIGRRGRGTAGRIFWAGFGETQVSGDQSTSSFRSAAIGALTALQASIVAEPPFVGLAVPHRTVAGAHPNPATSSEVVGFAFTDPYIDVQKDRLPGHKKHKKRRIV